MRSTVFMCIVVAVLVLIIGFRYTARAAGLPSPLPPNTALPPPVPAATSTPPFPEVAPQISITLSIPKIKLTAPIVPVGLTAAGAMDVPAGSSGNVGWYSGGTVPGAVGSAVIDAHVFAAFKNLHELKAGDDIFVGTQNGGQLHFKVGEVHTYALADVPAQLLFNRTGGRYLNLITCAGTYVQSRQTYDHRLVVYAELVP